MDEGVSHLAIIFKQHVALLADQDFVAFETARKVLQSVIEQGKMISA